MCNRLCPNITAKKPLINVHKPPAAENPPAIVAVVLLRIVTLSRLKVGQNIRKVEIFSDRGINGEASENSRSTVTIGTTLPL